MWLGSEVTSGLTASWRAASGIREGRAGGFGRSIISPGIPGISNPLLVQGGLGLAETARGFTHITAA